MAYKFQCLADDDSRYLRSFQLFLERSSEHQCMLDFVHGVFSDILASIGEGSTSLNVLGVGSGAGEIDLEMLSQLHRTHPGLMVDNEVVEPSSDMLHKYKALVSKASNLDYVLFKWNEMTASEFENHWQEKNFTKKMDFIHMIQMLYYVSDPHATLTFFRSLLKKNGKLMIILVSEKSGWGKLWKTYRAELCKGDISQCLTTGDIKSFLDADGVKYKSYQLPSLMDITEVFIEGNEKGDLLLDFLTEVAEFRKCAPPDLKVGVLDLLQHPDCSTEMEGKIVFNNSLEVLVLDA